MDPLANDMNFITKGLAKLDTVDGLSFAGKQLKLENENDAQPVVDAIKGCKNLQQLNLEGNSVGVNAAKAIGKALSTHKEFKRAIWKDMFTGRMKDEIPEALRVLGSGLAIANACLTELDLSDNAFGPIGMEGLVSLLKSPCCYALEELKLNNNGLGITGAKLLAKALMDTYDNSKERGKPFGLRVFIAGRNRLENEGAIALAEVFLTMGTLEELSVPQNGIYYDGITQLSRALKRNKNLRILNLNDNTVGPRGCESLVRALPKLKKLTSLNLGDCLIKTIGALIIAQAFEKNPLEDLQELVVDFNEISKVGGISLAKALRNKHKLTTLQMDGNKFGEEGREQVKAVLEKNGQISALVSLDEDNDEDSDEEEDPEEVDTEADTEILSFSEGELEERKKIMESMANKYISIPGNFFLPLDDESISEPESFIESPVNKSISKPESFIESPVNKSISKPETVMSILGNITAADFLLFPTPERFLALKANKADTILTELKIQEDAFLESLVAAIMKVSSLTSCNVQEVRESAKVCCNTLYRALFHSCTLSNTPLSLVSNCLLVHLGLIKSEEKHWKIPYNQEQCKETLKLAMSQDYFPKECSEVMSFFINRKPIQPGETITVS